MPGGSQWILHGQQNDTFDLKFWLGLELARETGEYTPRTQHAELFIVDDGTPLAYPRHYRGIYMGIEHIERGFNTFLHVLEDEGMPMRMPGKCLNFVLLGKELSRSMQQKYCITWCVAISFWFVTAETSCFLSFRRRRLHKRPKLRKQGVSAGIHAMRARGFLIAALFLAMDEDEEVE
eukprot:jgi/Botrbrau1/7404/Bobra.0112s0005.1